MTIRLAAEPEAGRRSRAVSILDLLDDAATGHGTVHFVGEEPEPTPIGALWDESGARGPLDRRARRHRRNRRRGAHEHTRLCRHACSARGAPAARSRRFRCRRAEWRRRSTPSSSPGSATSPARTRSCSTRRTRRCSTMRRSPVHTFDEALSGGARVLVGVPTGALVQFTSGSVGNAEGHLSDARRRRRARRSDPGRARARRRRRLLLVAAAVARHGPDRAAAVAAGRRRSPIRSSPPHAHEARDVRGQSAVVAAHLRGNGLDDHRRAQLRVGARGPHERPHRVARSLVGCESFIVGSEAVHADTLDRFADAFEPAGLPAARVLPRVRHGGGDARRHDRPAGRAVAFDRARRRSTVAGAPPGRSSPPASPLDGCEVRVDRARRRGRPDRVPQRRRMLSRYIGADLRSPTTATSRPATSA